MPTLDSFIIAEARQSAYRLRQHITEQQLRISGHSSALTDLYTYKPVLGAPNDFMRPTYVFERNFKIITPNRDEWKNDRTNVDYRSHVYFADGSKRMPNSGYGIHMANDNRDLFGHCGEFAEITQAEILAIENCCLDAIQNDKQGRINIYSDSLGALHALKKYRIDSSIILGCFHAIQELATRNEVILTWIPSNLVIYGHTQADRLAKTAADLNIAAPKPLTTINRSVSKVFKVKWLEQCTESAWRNTTVGEHTKCFLSVINPKISRHILNLNKPNIRVVIGLLTGHCKVNSHLARLRLRDDPDCDLCGAERETAMHLLCKCTTLHAIRTAIYGKQTINTQEILTKPLAKLISYFRLCCEQFRRFERIF